MDENCLLEAADGIVDVGVLSEMGIFHQQRAKFQGR
jgi:hypothetical protein